MGELLVGETKEQFLCPRCNGFIPDNEEPGAYIGALSRKDGVSEICSACGTEEAFAQHRGHTLVNEDWPIKSDRARA